MTAEHARPPASRPTALRARGRGARLWRDVTGCYALRVDELAVLEDACRHLDLVDRIEKEIVKARSSLTTAGSQGQSVANPLLGELRQSRDLVGRLLRSLHLPDDPERGDLATGRGSNAASISARHAANARWGGRT